MPGFNWLITNALRICFQAKMYGIDTAMTAWRTVSGKSENTNH